MFLSIVGCELLFPCSYEEVYRILSPDDKVEAVLVKGNCGATTSYTYSVYVVPTGDKYEDYYVSFLADHVDALWIKWRKAKFLEISYYQARIFKYSNSWQTSKLDEGRYVVEIREIPLTDGHALSAEDRWDYER